MDNYHFDMTCIGEAAFRQAMTLAFGSDKASGYLVKPDKGLIFTWIPRAEDGVVLFPFKMDGAGAADFALRWLNEVDYGKEPYHDGDNSRGWRLYNEAWGHVGDHHYAIIAVKPAWAMHGK